MSIDEIPVRSDLDYYAMTVDLGGTTYRLSFRWNTRDERWYMAIATSAGVSLIESTPIVVDFPLLLRYADTDLPEGYLVVTDTTGEGVEPAKDDLGDRVKLIFIPSDELT